MAAGFRDAVERRSVVMLTYLSSLPRVIPFGLVIGLLMSGLLTTGVLAFAALAILTVFMLWLLYVGWPEMTPVGRALRTLATLLIAAAAVGRLIAG